MKFHDVDGIVREHAEMSPAAFHPETLAPRLANIRRYCGLPIALTDDEHLVLSAYLAREAGEDKLVQAMCLTHDLCEAFLGDMNGVHKPEAVRVVEREMNHILAERGWLVPIAEADCALVKKYDCLAQAEERRKIWPLVYGPEKHHARPRSSWLSWVKFTGAYNGPA